MRYLRWLWLLVPIAGVIELLGHWYYAAAAPRPGQWKAIASDVRRLRQRGELVVIAPEWAEPLARAAFGDELMPFFDSTRPDSSAYPRAVEVSILGQRDAELAGWREIQRARVGRFELRVIENPHPSLIRYGFLEHLEPRAVEVTQVQDGRVSTCTWTDRARSRTGGLEGHPTYPRERFQCGGGEFPFVGITVIDDQRYRPRRCIWANPRGDEELRLMYRRVPLGKTLHGYLGTPWMMTRDDEGPPVELTVVVDGEEIGTFSHQDQEGWKAFDAATAGPEARTADVEFRVSAPQGSSRQSCFYADLR